MVLPSRFATASHVTVVCILALLTHDTCKSVVTPPPLCACWSWTRSAHVVRASTSVAMHPPCKVPNRLQSSGATKSSQATPVPSFLSRLRFEQCWNGIRSKVPASFADDAFGPKTTESKKARARENPSSSSSSSIIPRNFSFFATSTTNDDDDATIYIREKKPVTTKALSQEDVVVVVYFWSPHHEQQQEIIVVEGESRRRKVVYTHQTLLDDGTPQNRETQLKVVLCVCCNSFLFARLFFWCAKTLNK